eukprot:scaffold51417_cov36-Phaeocystis_antarctica.AAC.2
MAGGRRRQHVTACVEGELRGGLVARRRLEAERGGELARKGRRVVGGEEGRARGGERRQHRARRAARVCEAVRDASAVWLAHDVV